MLPSFLVVGTKRGGSTSLYEYLLSHPDVLPCAAKKGTHYFDVNYSRGWRWFRSFFPTPRPGAQTGEASPYYMFHPLAPARIAAALPAVRIVAALRDPVDRAYSHYQYNVARGFEQLPLAAALDAEPERLAGEVDRMSADPGYCSFAHRHYAYLARGRYAEQLDAIYAVIPPERVLLLQSEALYADPAAALTRVFRFLGLAPYDLPAAATFKAGRYPPLPPGLRRRLEDYYAEPNSRLAGMPGVTFGWPRSATSIADEPAGRAD